jgi:hypothetical protein
LREIATHPPGARNDKQFVIPACRESFAGKTPVKPEIKRTSSPNRADIKNFAIIEKLGLKAGTGGVIRLTEESLPLSDSMMTIPVQAL